MGELRELLDPVVVAELVGSVKGFSSAEAETALIAVAAIEGALRSRVGAPSEPVTGGERVVPDHLLTAKEVAQRYGRSVDWVYRQAKRWPFTVREGRGTLRFSERGLERHLSATRQWSSRHHA
jgi:hypothetical protein